MGNQPDVTGAGETVAGSGGRVGATLAAARTAAGLDLAEVARETRVPLRHLKAIEADQHEPLPALPYAIGSVRSFARAVGLDPEATAAQFRAETSKTPHVPAPMAMAPLDERRLPSPGIVTVSVVIVVAVIAGLSAWGAGLFDAPPPAAPGTAAAPIVAAAPDPAPAAVPAAAMPVPVTGQVVLRAKEEVWVKIYDKATRTNAKIGVMAAGETYAVPAEPAGLLLWTGKAGALTVSVGGRELPPLGGPVETVKDVSLAAADLIARTTPGATPGGDAAAAPSGPKPIATIPGA